MSSYLNERSVILENWMFIAPILVLVVTYLFVKENRRNNKNKSAATIAVSSSEKIDSLAESEYIGEYQEDGTVNEEEYAPFLKDEEHIPFHGATVTLDGGAAKFYEIANNRRSVRKYSRRDIDIAVIEKCIQAAGTSPSGAHTQPWTFCLVQNPTIKQKIRDIIEDEELENYTKRMSRKWTTDLRPLKTNHVKEYLTDAPYLILVFKKVYGRFS